MILCCGEALIDMLPREDANGAQVFAPHAGGAIFNTAIALGRLGVPVQFFSQLSTDFFGDMLRSCLAASNVDASPCPLVANPTTLAFVRLVDGQATYAFFDENSAGRSLSETDLPEVEADALYFGGISLVGEPAGSAYEHLAMRSCGARVSMIDPNIRPGLITDESAYRKRLDAMMAAADIVKLSDEDLRWLFGPADEAQIAQGLLAQGSKVVIVTRGAAGAAVYSASGQQIAPAQSVGAVIDTVGAGDSFNAGVLAALHQRGALTKQALTAPTGELLTEALTFGARVAGIVVSRAGADAPWAREL